MKSGSLFQLILVGLLATTDLACVQSPWTELQSVDDLAELFNREVGKPRIILLLSPT